MPTPPTREIMKKIIVPITVSLILSGCATVSKEDEALCAPFVQFAHGLAYKQGVQLSRADAIRIASKKEESPDPDGGRAAVKRFLVHMVNFAYDNRHLSSSQFERDALAECSRYMSRN